MGETADIVLEGIEQFDQGRFDEALEGFTDDIEWRTALQPLLGINATRGREQVREFWYEAKAGWDDFRVEPVEAEELDEETVLVTALYYGRGHSSEVTFGSPIYSVYRLRDGRVCSVRDFATREAALTSFKEDE